MNYGLANPITYELYITNQCDEYSAYLKHGFGDNSINNTFIECVKWWWNLSYDVLPKDIKIGPSISMGEFGAY